MRTVFLALAASIAASIANEGAAHAASKTNTVVAVTQEQDQWCWAGATRSALLYFGVDKKQCELVEWTRVNNTASDRNFGRENCCSKPSGACNDWNYFWDSGGSIEELVQHFAGAKSTRYDLPNGALSLAQVTAAIDAGKLFFIRWQLQNGGGHFILGHGYDGTLVHYMNPWPNEGIKIAEHAWMVSGDTHTWRSSLVVGAQSSCSNKADGTACDDGNPCTTGDKCKSGACAGAPVTCASSSSCASGATCNPSTGLCAGGTSKLDGTSCDDGDPCTSTDQCLSGVCRGAPRTCAADGCHKAGICDPATGQCSAGASLPDGTTCDDRNPCTTADRCQAGVCRGALRTCIAIDDCHQAGVCDSSTGQCSAGASKADGTSCDDHNSCTTADRCQAGVCQGSAKSCPAIDSCHRAGVCDSATGACMTSILPDGSRCANGTCASGVCQPTADDKPPPGRIGCSASGAGGLAWPLALLSLFALRGRGRSHRAFMRSSHPP